MLGACVAVVHVDWCCSAYYCCGGC